MLKKQKKICSYFIEYRKNDFFLSNEREKKCEKVFADGGRNFILLHPGTYNDELIIMTLHAYAKYLSYNVLGHTILVSYVLVCTPTGKVWRRARLPPCYTSVSRMGSAG